jgi:hypothetical protein
VLKYTHRNTQTGENEMNKHTATCPDGTVVTRNSKTRTYSHCVVVWRELRKAWVVEGWASRLDLAQKLVSYQSNRFQDHVSGSQKDKDYAKVVWGDSCQCRVLEATVA